MEDNKQVNLPPVGGDQQEEEKKKKPLGGFLLGKSALRARWSAGALVARLMASKAALVGLALGVTALAGLATMTLGDKSERGGGYGEALAFKPYESYSVGNAGAKDSMLSFPYAQGNKEYTDELYKASINPDYSEGDPAAEYEAETAETEAAGMDGAAAALQKSGGLASSGGGAGKAGGGSGSKNAAKNGSAANAAMKGSSSQAKGVAATGNAARAANSVRNQGRGAHGNMKTGGLSSDMNKGTSSLVPTALEARKAAAGVQFGETSIGSAGVGASGAEDATSTDISVPTEDSYVELPDPKDNTDQSGGASGMSASGSAAEELAKMTEKLKDYKDKAEELLEDLVEMAGDPEKLCNSTTLSSKLAEIHENSNDMLELLGDMNDAGYINDTKMNNWRCNVVLKMKETVDTFISDGVQKYCQAYSNQKQATQYVESCQAAMSANHNVDCSPVVTVANNYINAYNSLIEPFTKQSLKPVKDFESKLGSVKGLSEMLNEGEAAESCAAETQKD
ncbi:MAG: hypothetical protein GX410_09405 [Elusimicrobia bacterium]|nr:hypothetical protein [Elusimicrobiota bacterium]